MKLSSIHPNPKNPRRITQQNADRLIKSIEQLPQMMNLRPIVVDENGVILGGNMRFLALKKAGYKELPDEWVKRTDQLTEAQKREFVIKDNSNFGEYDWDALANEWDDLPLAEWGVDVPADWAGPGKEAAGHGFGSLAEKFGVPPFSVLNAREGWWQDRKRAWLALGIKSELGRGGAAIQRHAAAPGPLVTIQKSSAETAEEGR